MSVDSGYLDPEDVEEVDDAFTVIALDPGGTTGWALFHVHPDAMTGDPDIHIFGRYGNVLWWTAGEFTGDQDGQIDEIVELVASWPYARLVTEDFKIRQLNAYLDPVEINAALRWAVRPRRFEKQSPSLAMSTLTDERQKALGLWIPGKEHARDGVKHAYTYLRRVKVEAVKLADRERRTSA
jgi:hypothetical protein